MVEGLCNQDLAIRFGADSGWDEGTNRDITGSDGRFRNAKIWNRQCQRSGIKKLLGPLSVFAEDIVTIVCVCVCGRRLDKNR